MTPRAAGLLAGGAGIIWIGWSAGWPELTAMGTAAVALVVFVVVTAGRAPQVEVSVDQGAIRVVRGQQASVRVTVRLRKRGRWLRVVEGRAWAPVATSALPRPDTSGRAALRMPVDTSTRGERRIGPYEVVHGDPWSIVRRVTGRADGGLLTVRPRAVAVRPSALPALLAGDSDAAGRRRGDEHFHALRDYVLGDEPRAVHWRSSARAGKLVVKQRVTPAPNTTTIVLDCDASAYGSDDQFGGGWIAERFEAAVEVAASFAMAQAERVDQVHLVTTAPGTPVTRAARGAGEALLDALAAVKEVPPVEAAPAEIVPIVRRTHSRLVILVTGTPGFEFIAAMRAVTALASSTMLVRVGATRREPLLGVRVVDVESADDLARA